MKAKKLCLTLLLLGAASSAFAATPQELMDKYTREAATSTPGFKPSAERGQTLFTKEWGVSDTMPACTACHTKDIRATGKHVKTGKAIEPMSPAVNAERFTSEKNVAKWFKRNCTEVVGRECTAGEKADFIKFVMQGGK